MILYLTQILWKNEVRLKFPQLQSCEGGKNLSIRAISPRSRSIILVDSYSISCLIIFIYPYPPNPIICT